MGNGSARTTATETSVDADVVSAETATEGSMLDSATRLGALNPLGGDGALERAIAGPLVAEAAETRGKGSKARRSKITRKHVDEVCVPADRATMSELHVACWGDDGEAAAAAVQRVSSVAAFLETESTGKTALHCAATAGHARAVQLLLESGAVEVNAVDKQGCTAAWLAAVTGRVSVLAVLAEHSIGVACDLDLARSVPGKRGSSTPLQASCLAGYVDCVRLLLGEVESGRVTVCSRMLLGTAWRGSVAITRLLLQASVSHLVDVRASWQRGVTPFHVACEAGHFEVAKLLCNRSDIYAVSDSGMSALHYACSRDDVTIARWLIDMYIADNKKLAHPKHGNTPLHVAAQRGCLLAVKLLLDSTLASRIDVNAQNARGSTPLLLACRHGQTDVVRFLSGNELHDRVDLSITNNDGMTALHTACKYGQLDVVALLVSPLLADRVSLNRKAKNLATPFLDAVDNGHSLVVRLLAAPQLRHRLESAVFGAATRLARNRGRLAPEIECMLAARAGHLEGHVLHLVRRDCLEHVVDTAMAGATAQRRVIRRMPLPVVAQVLQCL